MPHLIDGHNLLHAIRKIDEHLQLVDELGLCRVLAEYMRRMKSRGVIIFDGMGPPDKEAFWRIRNPEILFSGSHTDADSILEEKIAANTHPKRLIVISSDRRVRQAARRRRAVSLLSEQFWILLQDKMRKSPKKIKLPAEKQHGIPEGEVDYWMKIFGLTD